MLCVKMSFTHCQKLSKSRSTTFLVLAFLFSNVFCFDVNRQYDFNSEPLDRAVVDLMEFINLTREKILKDSTLNCGTPQCIQSMKLRNLLEKENKLNLEIKDNR